MATAAKQETKGVTLIEAIRQGIYEEMTKDETVFVIGEDIGAYGGAFKLTEGFIDEFGSERMIDTPISEAAIVGAACGAALLGMKPVAEFQFIDFISAGFDLLTNYAAKCRYRRSEEHTSELQSLAYLVCRLLLEKKKNNNITHLLQ